MICFDVGASTMRILMLERVPTMRTTIQLDDNLHEMARRYAQESGTTLTALLEEVLREKLLARPKHQPSERVKLKTVNGRGMQRGVDLDDNAALLDLMETR